MDTEIPKGSQQEGAPEELEARPAEEAEEEKSPEQIIDAFEAKTAGLKATQEQHLQSIESARKSRAEYADSTFPQAEERVKELDDLIAGKERLVGGLSAELEARGPSEAELRVEDEIAELDKRMAVQEAKKDQVGFSAYPEKERAEIGRVLANIHTEKERKQAQLQGLKLRRIHEFNMKQKLRRERGIYTSQQAQEAAAVRAAAEEESRVRLKESAAQVLAREREREARVEAPEAVEEKEKSNRWSRIRRTLGRATPGGMYAFVRERRAVAVTAKDLAAQVKFQERLVVKAMSPEEGRSTGFLSERGARAELKRIKEALRAAAGAKAVPELVMRFNEARGEVSKKEVEANHWTMEKIVNRAGEVLKRELALRGRADFADDRLEGFKAELRERLQEAQNNQLVGDTINYTKLIRNALNPDALDREVFAPLEEAAEVAAGG